MIAERKLWGDVRNKNLQADSEVTDPKVAAELKKRRTFRTFSYRGIELDKLLDMSNEDVRSRIICAWRSKLIACRIL